MSRFRDSTAASARQCPGILTLANATVSDTYQTQTLHSVCTVKMVDPVTDSTIDSDTYRNQTLHSVSTVKTVDPVTHSAISVILLYGSYSAHWCSGKHTCAMPPSLDASVKNR